jgi:ABC-2 type transport system permease protein
MNTQPGVTSSNMASGSFEAQGSTPISAIRLLYWSVQRELWENRSIYLAPLAVAAIFLIAFLVSIIALPHHRLSTVMALNPAKQRVEIQLPYEIAGALIMGTALIVGIFYLLDALYGERRDRSILFWKSLPVSDLTTVLAKASVPFVLLLLSFAITFATQLIMLLLSTTVLLANGLSAAPLWTQVSLFHSSLTLLYHLLTVHGLWYAPLYGWLLLVSASAPRAPLIWAVVPPFVICAVEKITFNTTYFLNMLKYRLTGPETHTAPGSSMMDQMAAFTAAQFFSEPGLWIGLAIAAVFLAATVRLRRYRGPI